MCIAIPYGKDNNQNESPLWHKIRTTPLYLLGLGAVIELLLLLVFWLSVHYFQPAAELLVLEQQQVISYMLLAGAGSFLFLALSMHFYPKLMQSGEIEYLYFGGYFFLTLYNSVFFYLAAYLGHGLVISSIIIQSLLLLFAFKPLWWAFYWTRSAHKKTGYVVNTLLVLLLLTQISFIFT